MSRQISIPEYSDKYFDASYEYRHVILPKEMVDLIREDRKKDHLLSETEWRNLGVVQSRGWVHYENHM